MDMNGGRLPPNPAKPPSIQAQLDSKWRATIKNGYRYQIDIIERQRQVDGQLTLGPVSPRSKRPQAEAGGSERRPTDDGGHFIAARFNGPRDRLNHFAQDASFNRGAYRAIEDNWARALRAGQRVFVRIVPHYAGTAARPSKLEVVWYIDGERFERDFPNEPKGRANAGR